MNRLVLFLSIPLLVLACASPRTKPAQSVSAALEAHRPQYHFTPPAKWMNDPNGLVWYEGEYHFFYQYFPDGTVWGPMHWGHAVSNDMVHWEHLPIALYPDTLGYIFSGSVVIDHQNTSGLGKNGQPAMIALFTYHDMAAEKSGQRDWERQGLAYSNDKGRTWEKYEGNPVLPNPGGVRDFRDPKVLWHEGSRKWVMTLSVGDHTAFWGSPDLKKWSHLSDFGQNAGAHGGVWECPDLFPIKASDGREKWALLVNMNPGAPNGGSGIQYFIGQFDGQKFIPDLEYIPGQPPAWLEYGRDNYAGVTWSNVPQKDGRRLLIGWMSNWDYAMVVPTERWRSGATLPRQLSLRKTSNGYRLYSNPVKELQELRETPVTSGPAAYSSRMALAGEGKAIAPTLSEWILEFDLTRTTARSFGVELSNIGGERYRIGFDRMNNRFFSDRTQSGKIGFSPKFADKIHFAPRFSNDSRVALHLYFDVASAELFADDGATVMTELFFPHTPYHQMALFADGGTVQLVKAAGYGLSPVAFLQH